MHRNKTRKEISQQCYLTKTDISKLLDVTFERAVRIFNYANGIDNSLQYRVEPLKVRITSVCKIVGFTLEEIQLQAKGDIRK